MTEVDSMQFTDEEISSKSLRTGDLLVCEGGDIGRAAIWNGELDACGFQNHLHRLRPKTAEVVPRFFMYYLQAGFTQLGLYEGAGNKTTIPNLSKHRLSALEVPRPTTREQERIATVLSKVQRAIEIEEKLIATARELKQAAMRKLFTRGLRGEPQRETPIGVIPLSWDLRACELICDRITVGIVVRPASYYVPSGIPAFRSLNVREDGLDTANLVFISSEHNDTLLSKSKLRRGDVLVVRTGYPGTSCVVPPEYDGANCIDVVVVRPKKGNVSSAFLSHFFNSEAGRAQANSSKAGLAQQHLNVSAVKRMLVPVPTIIEQEEIADILVTIHNSSSVHERKRAVLQDLFKTLLHKLMTGEIRVHDLDIDVSEVANP